MIGAGRSDRGQLVLLAGVVVALALSALLAAYLGLGYHADPTAVSDGHGLRDGERFLDRATHTAARDLRGVYTWDEREALVTDLRASLDPRRELLEGVRAEEGVVSRATYNASAASGWVADHCPGGPGRAFGSCIADRGVALQNRGGQPHVLAVAFDLRVTTDDGRARATLVVNATA